MKLLVLSRYDRLGASSRLRTMQYRPWLDAAGLEASVIPFFDDAYLERLYRGSRDRLKAARYYLNRVRMLAQADRPDVIWLEKELLPWLPFGTERWFLPRGVPVVSDYDDAIFHNYDIHPNLLVRALLGRKIDKVMARSALVLAGNPYLAARAQAAGAGRVEIVPTVVDADAYDTTRLPDPDGRLRIGWIGSPGTWASYMQPVMPMLSEIARAHGARIRAVGANATATAELEVLPWSEADESRMIQSMDIGLMPLDDSPWSRGKCGYKIIQYMASGVPVIASPVGVNSQIVDHGVTGFLARTESEWHEALDTLLRDEGLRHRMGAAGRKRMEERYSLQVWGPRVAALLRSVAQS